MRLLALDADGRTLFSRRLRDAARGAWSGIAQPLFLFRWGDRVGRWSEVRSLGVATYGGPSLEVDHLRAGAGPRGARSAAPPDGWLAALAFRAAAREAAPEGEDEERDAGPAPRPVRIEAGPVRLLDPAVKEDAAAAARIGQRARHIAAWLDRVAAARGRAARRRAGGGHPRGRPRRREPLPAPARARVARRHWVPAPRGRLHDPGHRAISDDPKLGIDRPVVFHEAVHAVAARRLRIPPGQGPADGLQEGLATYLQFALFPASFDRRQRPAVVERWRPLAEAAKDPGFNDYPGLAGVVAFLVSERPEWLGSLAGSLAHGATFEAAVKAAPGGATIAALDRDWRHWARRTLCDKKAPRHAPPADPGGVELTRAPVAGRAPEGRSPTRSWTRLRTVTEADSLTGAPRGDPAVAVRLGLAVALALVLTRVGGTVMYLLAGERAQPLSWVEWKIAFAVALPVGAALLLVAWRDRPDRSVVRTSSSSSS